MSLLDRPDVLPGKTAQIKSGLGTVYVTVNYFERKPDEVIIKVGRSGQELAAHAEVMGRLITRLLRRGVSLGELAEEMKGIGGDSPLFVEGGLVKSLPDAISRILEKHFLNYSPQENTELSQALAS